MEQWVPFLGPGRPETRAYALASIGSAPRAHDVLGTGRLVGHTVRGFAFLEAKARLEWASRRLTLSIDDVHHTILLMLSAVDRPPPFRAEIGMVPAPWIEALCVVDVEHVWSLVSSAMRGFALFDPEAGVKLAARVLTALVNDVDHIRILALGTAYGLLPRQGKIADGETPVQSAPRVLDVDHLRQDVLSAPRVLSSCKSENCFVWAVLNVARGFGCHSSFNFT
jgi:hypothetical protein